MSEQPHEDDTYSEYVGEIAGIDPDVVGQHYDDLAANPAFKDAYMPIIEDGKERYVRLVDYVKQAARDNKGKMVLGGAAIAGLLYGIARIRHHRTPKFQD